MRERKRIYRRREERVEKKGKNDKTKSQGVKKGKIE